MALTQCRVVDGFSKGAWPANAEALLRAASAAAHENEPKVSEAPVEVKVLAKEVVESGAKNVPVKAARTPAASVTASAVGARRAVSTSGSEAKTAASGGGKKPGSNAARRRREAFNLGITTSLKDVDSLETAALAVSDPPSAVQKVLPAEDAHVRAVLRSGRASRAPLVITLSRGCVLRRTEILGEREVPIQC